MIIYIYIFVFKVLWKGDADRAAGFWIRLVSQEVSEIAASGCSSK